MSVGTTAALVGAGISAAGAIGGAAIKSHAAGSAADKASAVAGEVSTLAQDSAATAANTVDAGTAKANERLAGLPDKVKELLAPYLDVGSTSATGLKQFLQGEDLNQKFAFNPSDLINTPGYKFTLSQGMEAIKRAASSQGKSLGGGTLKSIAKYGEGLAQTTYGNEFDRALQTFNTNRSSTALKLSALMDATQLGQRSATDVGNTVQASEVGQAGNELGAAKYRADTGMDAARIIANAKTGAANSSAAAAVAKGNAWGDALSGGANSIGEYFSLKDIGKVSSGLPAGQVPYTPSYYELYGKVTP